MYCYRHAADLFTIGSSLFSRGGLKTSVLRSQGCMNFLFVRIYKTANLDYLENKHLDDNRNFGLFSKTIEYSFAKNTLFILYMIKKEAFARFIRQMFTSTTQLQKISKYLEWKRLSEAGLCSASLLVHDHSHQNYFCGRFLEQPVLHKYDILRKKCDLSEITETHTSSCEPFDVRKYVQETETESEVADCSRLSHTVSVPNIEKLEMALNTTKDSKSMYDEDLNDNQSKSEWTINGKIIELMNSSFFSLSSNFSEFA
ncbi:unnamed protein product [Moneuplotes crassus]|uniref:Uncharacterized protein n=1 Tax=Euplotes crassus TaxID=5936 RepID=A0AAD1XI17_EUPCR|nr:unnamed protein product [Moneuplotes crassus]